MTTLSWARRWLFGNPASPRNGVDRVPARRPRRTGLRVEALEDRTVPTVFFQPHFAGTAVISGHHAKKATLKSDQVVLIFAGNYWTTTQGTTDEKTLANSVNAILTSPYLSGLTQYGGDGKASLSTTTTVSPTVPLQNGYPTLAALQTYVNKQLRADPSLVPSTSTDKRQEPLYVVFNDPNSSGSGEFSVGLNEPDGASHLAYVGTKLHNGSLWLNDITASFSHELAEATASGIVVNDPGQLKAGGQICDNEPEFGQAYLAPVNGVDQNGNPVNGVMVQAYWSQKDGAWAVPDGGPDTTLVPVWAGKAFTGAYQQPNPPAAPTAGTGASVVGRQNTFVVTTDGALWEHSGTTWIQLVSRGVQSVQVGQDSAGNDAAFVLVSDPTAGNVLLEHTGKGPTTGWTSIDSGVASFSASQVQANTLFDSTGSDLWEYAAGYWAKLQDSGVTGFQAGKGGNGKAAVFASFDGTIKEYAAGRWTQVDTGVAAFSASQVQADTVFESTGSDLWEYAAGTWAKLADSGVTAFQAGKATAGVATVFAVINGDLWEHATRTSGVSWYDLHVTGLTSFSASQYQADTVFTDIGGTIKKHTGHVPGGWLLIL